MSDILNNAISACNQYSISFCKFISANDAGSTGAHQVGFYIPKNSWSLLFDSPGLKGDNKDKLVQIRWQDDFTTDSRFIWYGQGTRSEYRITRFGKGFPFFTDEHVGSLLILAKVDEKDYLGYVLDTDEDIDSFLSTYGMNPTDTNNLIKHENVHINTLEELIDAYVRTLTVDFPQTAEVSWNAREIFRKLTKLSKITNPDKTLVEWLETEYTLFKAIESSRYNERIHTPFSSVDELIECANTLLNRRKSRAGKSLEHHLDYMLNIFTIPFTKQAQTEGNKRPDFIFPSQEAYHNLQYPQDKLVFLGAKTTCKDRWRQVLNEADRIPQKHLFTLQQGISNNQLKEMYENNVVLVVPEQYRNTFPESFRERILNLKSFISFTRSKLE